MKIEAIRKKLEKVAPGQPIGPLEIDLSDIRIDPTMQVRDRLDKKNMHRIRAAYRAGTELPALALAFVEGDASFPIVLDGHHRFTVLEALAAEARLRGGPASMTVQATFVSLTEAEARLQAALANFTHGLQLKARESRRVFAAYVKAGRHRKGDDFKSYRDMGKDMGRDHKTIIAWMKADFPSEAAGMMVPEKATAGGDGPPPPVVVVAHAMDAWLLEGRCLFEQGGSSDRSRLAAGLRRLLRSFEVDLAREEWDGTIPGLDLEASNELPVDVDF
ncbi:hypothetical protein [Rhizobium sp. AG855]|uniref:hypothetical protein n=1 Tax=Rhizobium sp. AG855 TaxID=2183898 RepID=UPI000E720764|nr:hypothetical protein [Rhizobium sp. AG855]